MLALCQHGTILSRPGGPRLAPLTNGILASFSSPLVSVEGKLEEGGGGEGIGLGSLLSIDYNNIMFVCQGSTEPKA